MSNWGTRSFLITPPISLARELWRYGEPALAERAMALTLEEALDLGVRIMQMYESGEAEALWPGGPKDKALVLAAIEKLEGAARPARRRVRRPEEQLPPELQVTLAERMEAASRVSDGVNLRLGNGTRRRTAEQS